MSEKEAPDIIGSGMRELAKAIRMSTLQAASALAELTCAAHGQEALGKEVASNIKKLGDYVEAASVARTTEQGK